MLNEKLIKSVEDQSLYDRKIPLNIVILNKDLDDSGIVPTRSNGNVGYDLYSPINSTLKAKSKLLIPLNISVAVPDGTYGRVAPRSGLASKHFIDVGAGVIDPSYRGNLGVLLFNHSDDDYEIKRTDRIAQLILEKCYLPDVVVVNSLTATDRGVAGFGSSGK